VPVNSPSDRNMHFSLLQVHRVESDAASRCSTHVVGQPLPPLLGPVDMPAKLMFSPTCGARVPRRRNGQPLVHGWSKLAASSRLQGTDTHLTAV
jgi:hypothetical protein